MRNRTLIVATFLFAMTILSLNVCAKLLPFPGPFFGKTIDAQTGEPIQGAKVVARWWCHDSPIPDGPGSFFHNVFTETNKAGEFRIEKQTRRGGFFGTSFSLGVTSLGYIEVNLIGDLQNTPLPESTQAYPFTDSFVIKSFAQAFEIKLRPTGPACLAVMKSDNPKYKKIAREKLEKLLGVNYGYDVAKWEEALQRVRSGLPASDKASASGAVDSVPCPCAEFMVNYRKRRRISNAENDFISGSMGWKDIKAITTLLDQGVNVNVTNSSGYTALMSAAGATGGNVEVVRLLIVRGADVNIRNKDCQSALMIAAKWNNIQSLKLLLAAGAKVNDRDKNCETALFKALAGFHKTTDNNTAVNLLKSYGAIE